MDGNQKKIRNLLLYIGIPVVVLFIIIFLFNNRTPQTVAYKYSDIIGYFQDQEVSSYTLNLGTGEMVIHLEDGKTVGYVLPSVDLFYMDVRNSINKYNEEHPDARMEQDIIRPVETSWFISLLPTLILFAGLIIFWVIMMRRLGSSMGGDKQMNFGKAKIKQMSDEKRKTTFADVAGADEEKEELREIVEFLKNPNKYNSLGARIPKGVLLVGPPGTGKTLLARAVAGEAGVPFFSISGSDFVEMYVGVGASRVRDLFETAKKTSPCIVFIDEIDAVGRHRGAGWGGGHDEREQTLNQLLVEMDGFGVNDGVIVIAATNRPDILDPALLRPGRFDRQITVNYPDIKGRVEILKVHARNKPLEETVDLETVAKSTAGFTGADLANLLNEAALLAARKGKKLIGMEEIEEANIKVIVGPQKKSRVIKEEEKRATAYHEAGHAIVEHFLPTQDPVHQISIIPSGRALGYTLSLPTEDKNSVYKNEMLESIASLLGGRVAEKLMLKDVSAGASNDIQRATEIARKMVTQYGMSDRLGPIVFGTNHDEVFLGKDFSNGRNYSEKIASEIDDEIHSIVTGAFATAERILTEHMEQMKFIAEYLVGREVMDRDQFLAVFEEGATFEKLDAIKEEKAQKSKRENEEKRRKAAEEEAAKAAEPQFIDTEDKSGGNKPDDSAGA